MTWTPPSFAPQIYQGYRQCSILCEKKLPAHGIPFYSMSSPYTFNGIDPGTYCIVGLNGIYGGEVVGFSVGITTTLSSGK